MADPVRLQPLSGPDSWQGKESRRTVVGGCHRRPKTGSTDRGGRPGVEELTDEGGQLGLGADLRVR
jgi:hypothetical protein